MRVPLLQWTDDLATGMDEVDDQHRRLVEIINELGQVQQNGSMAMLHGVFGELRAYTEYHFRSEERLMRDHAIDDGHVRVHIAAHSGFIRHLNRAAAALTESPALVLDHMLAFLVDWLVRHVTVVDAHLVRHARTAAAERGHLRPILPGTRVQDRLLGTISELNEALGDHSFELLAINRRLQDEVVQRQAAEAALRQGELRLRRLVDTALDAVVLADGEGRIIEWNPQAERMFGWPRDEAIGALLHELMVPEAYRSAHVSGLQRAVASGPAQRFDRRMDMVGLHRSGREFPVELSIAVLQGQRGVEIGAFIRDISERKAQQEQLQLAYSVYAAASEAMLVTDDAHRIIAVNPAFTRLTRCAAEEVLGHPPAVFADIRGDAGDFWHRLVETLDPGGSWEGEARCRRRDGSVCVVWLAVNTVYAADERVLRRVALFSDITEKKAAEETIWRQANFDALTGLPNRRLFHDRLEHQMRQARRDGRSLALLFVDIDRFKEVNDSLGHAIGDALLVQAARRLEGCIRATDLAARIGGDEFTAVLADVADPRHIEPVVQEVLHALAAPFAIDGHLLYVSASIGIAVFPGDADDADALVATADQAMYVAKEAGRNRFSYFTAAMQHAAHDRLQLGNDLRGALAACQLSVHYQPIVELASGRVVKAEALLRWAHPQRGPVPPAEFVPLAENLGLIGEIGDWVFCEAARWVKDMAQVGGEIIQVSINKSPRQFAAMAGEHPWIGYLAELELPSHAVNIEITEGLLLEDRHEVRERLHAFRAAGMQISLDDFGTGYSAMSYLKRFSIDYLKIDQSFVRDMCDTPSDQAIVEAIIAMAHRLGIRVIAEGIETREQRDRLAAAGCDYGQGYFFARPLPGDEFLAWHRNGGAAACNA